MDLTPSAHAQCLAHVRAQETFVIGREIQEVELSEGKGACQRLLTAVQDAFPLSPS